MSYTGSGLILYIEEDENIKYCCLETKTGKYDFPKGGIDYPEHEVDCAIREAEEEANIKRGYFDFVLGIDQEKNYSCGDRLLLYLCKFDPTYINNLRILKNPETGIFEHEKVLWLTKNEANANLLPYMSDSLNWAENIILNLK